MNQDKLEQWLKDNHAECLWIVYSADTDEKDTFRISAYDIFGHVILVKRTYTNLEFTHWDMYVPASPSNTIDVVLDDAMNHIHDLDNPSTFRT